MLKTHPTFALNAAPSGKLDKPTQGTGQGFASALRQAAGALGSEVQVKAGDNITRLVHAHAASFGRTLSDGEAHRLAHQVAQSNGLPNADRIYPGQRLSMQSLTSQWQNTGSTPSVATRAGQANAPTLAAPAPAAKVGATLASAVRPSAHPVLERVLQRAVVKGYVPTSDLSAVREKIVSLATRHGFRPDDFARVSLMESDGLNPRASNGSCHGIIQFCDGPARGAASVGYSQAPQQIRSLSVLQQLDLVDTYLNDVAQAGTARLSLDDLYLSILTPAARDEKRRHVALPIAGTQAAALHVGRDTARPITRQSLVLGLYQHTQEALKN